MLDPIVAQSAITLTMLRRSAILLPNLREIDERNPLATRTSLAAGRRCNPSLHDTTTRALFICCLDKRHAHPFARSDQDAQQPSSSILRPDSNAANAKCEVRAKRLRNDARGTIAAQGSLSLAMRSGHDAFMKTPVLLLAIAGVVLSIYLFTELFMR
jgi:hypothetical protein